MKKTTPQTKRSKNLILAGDDKGGVTKSASIASLADALRQYGYIVSTYDGDHINCTLKELDPSAERVNAFEEDALDALLPRLVDEESDAAILDMPGSSGDSLHRYFEARGLDFFQSIGLNIIIALTVVENNDVLRGLLPWIKAFQGKAEFILLANGRDSLGEFNVSNLKHSETILTLVENRVINIPKFHPNLLKQYHKAKGTPSDYLLNGRRAIELNLTSVQSQMWKMHLSKVMETTEPHLEFLTGKEPPIHPEIILRGTGPKRIDTWEDLDSRLGGKPE